MKLFSTLLLGLGLFAMPTGASAAANNACTCSACCCSTCSCTDCKCAKSADVAEPTTKPSGSCGGGGCGPKA